MFSSSPSPYDLRQEGIDWTLEADDVAMMNILINNYDNTSLLDEMKQKLIQVITNMIKGECTKQKWDSGTTGMLCEDIDILEKATTYSEKVIAALNNWDKLSYTALTNSIFGKQMCVNTKNKQLEQVPVRKILAPVANPTQCNIAMVNPTKDKCWICGISLYAYYEDAEGYCPPYAIECEHVLGVKDALQHLNLIQSGSSAIYNCQKSEFKSILNLEYDWAHKCCNQKKGDVSFIKKNNPPIINNNHVHYYTVDTDNIKAVCYDIYRDTLDNGEEASKLGCICINRDNRKKDKGLDNIMTQEQQTEITNRIQEIVNIINGHVDFILQQYYNIQSIQPVDALSRIAALEIYQLYYKYKFFTKANSGNIAEFYIQLHGRGIKGGKKYKGGGGNLFQSLFRDNGAQITKEIWLLDELCEYNSKQLVMFIDSQHLTSGRVSKPRVALQSIDKDTIVYIIGFQLRKFRVTINTNGACHIFDDTKNIDIGIFNIELRQAYSGHYFWGLLLPYDYSLKNFMFIPFFHPAMTDYNKIIPNQFGMRIQYGGKNKRRSKKYKKTSKKNKRPARKTQRRRN